jgi:hypothetical protein
MLHVARWLVLALSTTASLGVAILWVRGHSVVDTLFLVRGHRVVSVVCSRGGVSARLALDFRDAAQLRSELRHTRVTPQRRSEPNLPRNPNAEGFVAGGFGFEWQRTQYANPPGASMSYRVIAPCWFLCTLTLTPGVLIGLSSLRQSRRRQREGRCAHCNYDLRATPGRCPECGREAVKCRPEDQIRSASAPGE